MGGALARHQLVSAASSSEPPTSMGLACRPVGAWRRHLVRQRQCMGRNRHGAGHKNNREEADRTSALTWFNPSIAHRCLHRSEAIFSGLPGRRALNVRNLRRQTAALAWHTLATGSHHQPFSHCADRSRIVVRFWVELRTHRSITSRWLTGQDPFAVTFVSLHRARQFEDPDTAPRCTGRDH